MITKELISGLDQGGMGLAIAGMGDQLLDAVVRTEQALDTLTLPNKDSITNIILAGLGGSAIGGDLVRSYLLSSLSLPFIINRTYSLPEFTGANSLVIVSSYSGSTEETLSMYNIARAKGAQIVCVSTGGKLKEFADRDGVPFITLPTGFQPRAALAYSFVPTLLVLERMGLCSSQKIHLKETADLLKELVKRYGPDAINEKNDAIRIATILRAKIPVIYSDSESLDTVNIRWRGQMQENAKHIAFGNVLPEMNHNEINGWAHPTGIQDHFVSIFLRSTQDEHERVGKRFEILKEVLVGKGVNVMELEASGSSRLARMFSLVALGDWISYYIALLLGEDPSPVPVIMLLKEKLASE